jgi:hypothetical protein
MLALVAMVENGKRKTNGGPITRIKRKVTWDDQAWAGLVFGEG